MTYHVLSNLDLVKILTYGIFGSFIVIMVFYTFARRDASPNQPQKSIWGKIIPWLVLCILLSDISLFVYRFIDYPWSIEPQPSQASTYREIRYMGSGYPTFGWANDYQLPLLSVYAGAIMWLGWTIYAFNFKRSDTSLWKKILKIIAYLIVSATILGFNMHELKDVIMYLISYAVVGIILWIAHVKPTKQMKSPKTETVVITKEEEQKVNTEIEPTQDEDNSRFMPKEVSLPTSLFDKTIEPTESASKKETIEEESSKPLTSKIAISAPEEKEEQNELSENNNEVVPSKDLEWMFCKYCGKRIEADSTFCKYCGKRL